jgi:hypothetical protein
LAENNFTQTGEPEDKTAEYNGRNIKLKRDEEVDKA